jgi:outer membrane protein OmpA-like peptidoglycan-associated protein
MLRDSNEIAEILEMYKYGENSDGDGRTVLDHVENRPIAVLGSYIAFPKEAEVPIDVIRKSEGKKRAGPLQPAENIVSIPTRGPFAETQLSHCNSCEEIDITRFWDWSQSPCPEKPSEITDVHAESHAIKPDLQPSTLPNSVVNIVNPPNAPDPTGLASATNLLATANIFRDMSGIQQVGSLLNSLVQNSGSMPTGRGTNQSSSSGDSSTGNRTSSAGGTEGTRTSQGAARPTPQEQHDQLQVNRNAADHGDITPSQARNMNRQYLENAQQPSEQTDTTVETNQPPYEKISYSILFAGFNNNQSILQPQHVAALNSLILILNNSPPDTRIEVIEGHAGHTEPQENDNRLSRERAETIRDYLTNNGLHRERYTGTLEGSGSSRPLQGNPRSPDIDVNRSVLIQISSSLRGLTSDRTNSGVTTAESRRSTEWKIRIDFRYHIPGHAGVGELKNVSTNEKRAVYFMGGGMPTTQWESDRLHREHNIQQSIEQKLTESGKQWINFTTTDPLDFPDFDGTQISLMGDHLVDYFIGSTRVFISFLNIHIVGDNGSQYIYTGQYDNVITGIKFSESTGILKLL